MILYYVFDRFLPDDIGKRIRHYFCHVLFTHVGKGVNIQPGVRFGRGSLISIGTNSGLGEGSYLVAMSSLLIGPQVMMLTAGHAYDDITNRLIDQKIVTAPITIGNDVWIGARVIILPGVTIGNRVVIGAGSFVTKSIPSHSLCAGVPCRVIKRI